MPNRRLAGLASPAVIVAALGYFVDIYDLILFSIVRVPSLKALGYEGEALFSHGVLLLNLQMFGMLVGGVFWGVLGDKRGRLTVLFGSIVLYSLANLGNGLVQTVPQYAALRFIAGVGLAGELGAGITLVAEVLPSRLRGYGTTIVASFGILGALLAGFIAESFDWRMSYFIGGFLGLALLVLRVSVLESQLFESVRAKARSRGDFFYLFRDRARLLKYFCCILIGVPIWYVIGILITFSPEFARELSIEGAVSAARAVMCCYAGLAVGDFTSGVLSQILQSRRKVVLLFALITLGFVLAYLFSPGISAFAFYALCFGLGFGTGYWAVFVTIGTEQFGTNLRATVTTTVPNFVRGSVVPLTASFTLLKGPLGLVPAALVIGLIAIGIALWALSRIEETFHKDMDFLEGAT